MATRWFGRCLLLRTIKAEKRSAELEEEVKSLRARNATLEGILAGKPISVSMQRPVTLTVAPRLGIPLGFALLGENGRRVALAGKPSRLERLRRNIGGKVVPLHFVGVE